MANISPSNDPNTRPTNPQNQAPPYTPGTSGGGGHYETDANGNHVWVSDGGGGGGGFNWQSLLKGGGSLLGGLAGYFGAQQNNATAGHVNLTTGSNPWGPSDPYRQTEMQLALALLGQGPVSSVMGSQGGSGAPGSTNDARPTQIPTQQGGGAHGGAGGGGGGGAHAPGYTGTTDTTQTLIQQLMNRANQGSSLYAPANQFVTGLLQGQDNNAYRQGAYSTYQGLSQGEAADPALQRFEDMLFAGQMPGSPQGGGGQPTFYGASTGSTGGAYGGGGAPVTGPVDAASYIKNILGGQYLTQGNPFQQAMDDAATREMQRVYANQTVPGINAQYSGAGMYGSTLYEDQMQRANQDYAKQIGDTVGGLNYQNYNARMQDMMQALGYGTQLDQTAMNNAAQLQAARIGAGASSASVNAQIQNQQALARLSALQGAIGQGIDLRQMGAGGMGQIGSDYGANQTAAMNAVPNISGLDLRDLQAAGDLSLGSQNSANQYKVGMGQVGVGYANARLGRDELNFQKQQYQNQLPWSQLGQYGSLINAASGGYGTQTQTGTDYRNNGLVNVYGQAAAGAIGGGFTMSDLLGMFGGGGSPGGGSTGVGSDPLSGGFF